ncbi:hypothetical protein [Streptomyces sp. NPDC101181]|uniref:hypothetical protein n=1 Tax=Streptomyces sp. NPDC101181 TaxID=3366125 RepID=UPI003827CE3B
MPAPTHPRSSRSAPQRVEVRLPWWAVALPAAAFALLLLMIINPGEATAAPGAPVLGQLIERALHFLIR